jgi:hypothetical protein
MAGTHEPFLLLFSYFSFFSSSSFLLCVVFTISLSKNLQRLTLSWVVRAWMEEEERGDEEKEKGKKREKGRASWERERERDEVVWYAGNVRR